MELSVPNVLTRIVCFPTLKRAELKKSLVCINTSRSVISENAFQFLTEYELTAKFCNISKLLNVDLSKKKKENRTNSISKPSLFNDKVSNMRQTIDCSCR